MFQIYISHVAVVVPISIADHNVVTVVKNSRDAGDDLADLSIKQILAVDSTEGEVFVSVVSPWSGKGHCFL